MLIRFQVKNFLSFASNNGSVHEFSTIAGKARSKRDHVLDDGKLRLLKASYLFGANGAGKSNLIKAMQFMRCLVLGEVVEGASSMYCKTDAKNQDADSYFGVEVKLGEKYYAYGFEYRLKDSKVVCEWLVELFPDSSEKVLFKREDGMITFGPTFSKGELSKVLQLYAKEVELEPSLLFLTMMNQQKKVFYASYANASVMKEMYEWFQDDLVVITHQEFALYDTYLNWKSKMEDVCSLLGSFGFGICGYEVEEVPLGSILLKMQEVDRMHVFAKIESLQCGLRREGDSYYAFAMRSRDAFVIVEVLKDTVCCKRVLFKHRSGVLFSLRDEADGMVWLLDLMDVLLSEEGKTYVVDDLDCGLHPLLGLRISEMFLQASMEKRVQLIGVCKQSLLLDFDYLRRDEVWFVEKKVDSTLYSLEEYRTRYDLKLDKAYLDGRFGAIPVFTARKEKRD